MEPLVRRGTGDARRTARLIIRMQPGSLREIDEMAARRGWTRADTVRALLRAGLDATQGR